MNIHKPTTTKCRLIASGLAVAAVAGTVAGATLIGGSGQAAAAGTAHGAPVTLNDATLGQTHGQTHGDARPSTSPWHLGEIRQPTLSRDRAPGGSQLKGPHAKGPHAKGPQAKGPQAKGPQAKGPQLLGADEATQVHMSITNSTNETLNLTSASDSGGSVHWQGRATDLAPGQNETVNVYAATDAQINLSYTGASTGAVFQLMGKTPTVGSNEATGSSSTTSYTVQTSAGSGYNPTDKYTIQPGQTFDYSGQTATYVVPPGVTQLAVNARGGAGTGETTAAYYNGAEVDGTMAVTPGEVITVGVGGIGGDGHCTNNDVAGGWGMTNGSDDYRGGNGTTSPMGSACPGGGATVILDPNDNVLLVAGGGGGAGDGGSGDQGRAGGRGGANGVWAGGNGSPFPGGGGQAGANSTTQGQDTTTAGELAGGAGGGGADGGLMGLSGGGAGGGAGGSVAPGLTGSTVSTASSQADLPATSWVIFSPVS